MEPLKDTEVEEGGEVILQAKITGAPQPKVKWFKDGKELISEYKVKISSEGETQTLMIRDTKKEDDAGNYVLKAENPSGFVEISASLLIKSKYCDIESQ